MRHDDGFNLQAGSRESWLRGVKDELKWPTGKALNFNATGNGSKEEYRYKYESKWSSGEGGEFMFDKATQPDEESCRFGYSGRQQSKIATRSGHTGAVSDLALDFDKCR
jgi:hypothetical protein